MWVCFLVFKWHKNRQHEFLLFRWLKKPIFLKLSFTCLTISKALWKHYLRDNEKYFLFEHWCLTCMMIDFFIWWNYHAENHTEKTISIFLPSHWVQWYTMIIFTKFDWTEVFIWYLKSTCVLLGSNDYIWNSYVVNTSLLSDFIHRELYRSVCL